MSDGIALKNVRMQLTPAVQGKDPQIYTESTDADGNFAFKEIKPGSYHFFARKAGFVSQAYLAKGPSSDGAILTLTSGQEIKDVLFRMFSAAVAIGKVVDEMGEPVAGVEVQALVRGNIDDYDAARVRSQTVVLPERTAVTNDLGEFRLYGLPPGRYYFRAINSGNPDYSETQRGFSRTDTEAGSKYPPVYYPGVFDQSQATQVPLRAGDEIRVDFRLQPQRTAIISGRVLGVNSQPATGVSVALQPRELTVVFEGVLLNGSVSADGKFVFKNVPPGSYLVTARLMSADHQDTGQQKIDVGGEDIKGLEITLSKPITLKGRVTSSTGGLMKGPIMIGFSPVDDLMDYAFAQVKEDGTLLAENLHEETYVLRANPLQGWYVESARLGKEDVLKDGLNITPDAADSSLEIILSQSAAELEGTVLDGDNTVPGVIVHLRSATPKPFHSGLAQSAVTDQNGHFVFATVTPGIYEAFAQEDTEDDSDTPKSDQKDATGVELGKNEHKSIRLEVIKH